MVMKEWHFEEEETSNGTVFSVYNQDGVRITEPYLTEESCRLIAAAPDLLNALQSMYQLVVEYDKVIWDCARAAIAKATAA